jgi:hypothetical protein
MANAPSRYWIIRHQDQSNSQVVGKLDTAGETQIPDDVANHDRFQVLEVSSRSALADKEIDHSVLTQGDKDVLSQVCQVDN